MIILFSVTYQTSRQYFVQSTKNKSHNESTQSTQKNENNATAQFNLGNALYKTEKKDEAVNAFEKANATLTKPAEKSNALYNKGVVLQNNKKLEECILNYKNALKLNPTNDDMYNTLEKEIVLLVESTPNDTDLGEKVRKLINNIQIINKEESETKN